MSRASSVWAWFLGVGLVGSFALGESTGCGDSTSTGGSGGAATCSKPGGPSPGAADAHCGSKAQPTDPAVCMLMDTGGAGGMGASSASTGTGTSASTGTGTSTSSTSTGAGGAGGAAPEYGPNSYGYEADDDDCKYHVKWSATPICENAGVTFTVTVTTKTDGKPVTGAGTYIEAVLGDTHPAPDSNPTTKETTPGTYQIGPVRFDKPGQWTVRFHIHGECTDVAETSQHGHAGFFVDVP